MLNLPCRLALVALVLFGLLLRTVNFTSADLTADRVVAANSLSAAVLNFSQSDTASRRPIDRLFEVSSLVPGGFAVASVRLSNPTPHSVPFRLTAQATSGSPEFCRLLDLELLLERRSLYQHRLDGFSYDTSFKPDQSLDLILLLSLPSADRSFINRHCQFDLVITSLRNGAIPQTGLFARRRLVNYVGAGTWD